MGTIKLKDGTVLENSYVILSGGVLYVYVQGGCTLAEVFDLLIDPVCTEKITALAAGGETEYTGYTKLISVRDEENGQITASLRKV
jgi:hypothetical protein